MLKDKIKLVQIIADSAVGGGPKHVFGILKYIDKEKFQVFLFCPPGYLANKAREINGVEVRLFNPLSKFDFFSAIKLRHKLNEIQARGNPFAPMILHTHGPRAALMTGVHPMFNMSWVHTEHLFNKDYHLKNRFNEMVQKKVLKWQFKHMKKIIAVSSAVESYLVESNLADKAKISVIPNGYEIREERNRKKINLVNKAPVIGTIGNLNKQKGHIYLIKAMVELSLKYPMITLEIIGEGPEKIHLQEAVEELKLEHRVSFLGRKENIAEYMKHWDVFVLPSLSETFGISILEAMESGVPVVASKVGGVPDVIKNNYSGLLVPPRDPDAISKAVIDLITHPVKAAKLKQAAVGEVKKYSWQSIIKNIENLYSNLEIS